MRLVTAPTISRKRPDKADIQLRRIYNRGGEPALKRHEEQKDAPDPFAQFFGGGRQEPPRTPTIVTNFEVSLADMYNGRTVEFNMPRKIVCPHCAGGGADSPKHIVKCGTCQGQGVVVQKHQVFPGMFTNVQMQ